MEGSGIMVKKLSYAEQLAAITAKMQEKIDLLHSFVNHDEHCESWEE